jgi:hypothetical protein
MHKLLEMLLEMNRTVVLRGGLLLLKILQSGCSISFPLRSGHNDSAALERRKGRIQMGELK